MSQKTFVPVIPAALRSIYDSYRYAPAVRIGADIHVSGIIGFSPDGSVPADLSDQIANVFDTMELVLREAGSGLSDVFSLTSYHLGDLLAQMPVFIRLQSERLGEPHPAWTAVGTTALALPGALIEVSAIARLPQT